MSSITTHPILTEIEAFLAAKDVTPSVFGSSAVNDPRFVFDLRAGREPRRATLEKVIAFMREAPPRQDKAPKKQAGPA